MRMGMSGGPAAFWAVILASVLLALGSLGCEDQGPCFELGGDCSDATSFSLFGRPDVSCCDATCTVVGTTPSVGTVSVCQ